MPRENKKKCNLALHEVRQHFPAKEFICGECAYCALLRGKDHEFYCGWLEPTKGRSLNDFRSKSGPARHVAFLLCDYELGDRIVEAGTEVLLERTQNAGAYLWVRVRRDGGPRRKKFLVSRSHLNLDGPLVKVHLNKEVEKITDSAVLIEGIWFPSKEIRLLVDAEGCEIEAKVGEHVSYIEIPEWLAQLKGLL